VQLRQQLGFRLAAAGQAIPYIDLRATRLEDAIARFGGVPVNLGLRPAKCC
jgi:hypothetical protein